MKTKYILHGGRTTLVNDLNKKFYSEIAEILDDGDTILMCYFAPSKNNNQSEENKFEKGVKLFNKNIPNKKIDYVFAKRASFIEELKKADVLYIHGGGTDELFDDLKKYPDFVDEMKKKKAVIGSSAGAYILAEYSIDYANRSEVTKRFGILPIKIFCHFDERHRKILEDKFRKVDEDNKFELVLLGDCETKIVIQ